MPKYTKSRKRTTYRKAAPKRYTRKYRKRPAKKGIRKWKRAQKKPVDAMRYFKVALKGSYTVRFSTGVWGTQFNYGCQFRRFGCRVNNLLTNKTIGVNDCNKAKDIFGLFKECAFNGVSVRMVPLRSRQVVDPASTG